MPRVLHRIMRLLQASLLFSGTAHADVYLDQQAKAAQEISTKISGQVTSSHEMKVNGQPSRMIVISSPLAPRDLIDQIRSSIVADLPGPQTVNQLETADLQVLADSVASQPFRYDSPGKSIFGQLRVSNRTTAHFMDAIRAVVAGDKMDLGFGYTIIADADPAGSGETIAKLSVYPGGLQLQDHGAEEGKDVPGVDISGIRRYPGSLRSYSIEDKTSTTSSRQVIYWGPAPLESHLAHYQREFDAAGWKIQDLQPGKDGKRVGFNATRPGEQAVFYAQFEPALAEVTDIIQVIARR